MESTRHLSIKELCEDFPAVRKYVKCYESLVKEEEEKPGKKVKGKQKEKEQSAIPEHFKAAMVRTLEAYTKTRRKRDIDARYVSLLRLQILTNNDQCRGSLQ